MASFCIVWENGVDGFRETEALKGEMQKDKLDYDSRWTETKTHKLEKKRKLTLTPQLNSDVYENVNFVAFSLTLLVTHTLFFHLATKIGKRRLNRGRLKNLTNDRSYSFEN